MFLGKKGYSFAMWALVFAVAITASAILFTPVKRALTDKVCRTTDLTLWGMWGDEAREEGGWNYNQIGALETKTSQSLVNKALENKGKTRVILDVTSKTTSSYSSY
jgi:hypothetical protein